MYKETLIDMTPSWRRTKIELNSIGRSEFRKNVARGIIFIGIAFMILLGVMKNLTDYTTAQVQSRDITSQIRYNNIRHAK